VTERSKRPACVRDKPPVGNLGGVVRSRWGDRRRCVVWGIARLVHGYQGDVVFAREGRGYLVVRRENGSQRGRNRDDEHKTPGKG